MEKHVISKIDHIFKVIEKEFDSFDFAEDTKDALEYFKNRSDMFIEDTKKSLE